MQLSDRAVPDYIPEPGDEQTSNQVELVGYVGREPEIRYTAEGEMVGSMSLATHRWHPENDVMVRTTDWHRIVAYQDIAETCRRLRPGELVRVVGRLHTRSWTDRSGARQQRTEIVADRILRVRPRPSQLVLDIGSRSARPQAA